MQEVTDQATSDQRPNPELGNRHAASIIDVSIFARPAGLAITSEAGQLE